MNETPLIPDRYFSLSAGLAAFILFVGMTPAQAGFVGDVRLTNDYVWRGVTRSNNEPAFQGSLGFAFRPGMYVMARGSTVSGGAGDPAFLELATVAGYKNRLFSPLWKFDAKISNFTYPGAGERNYPEAQVRIGYRAVYAALAFSDEFQNTKSNSYYKQVGFEHGFGKIFRVFAHLAHFRKKVGDGNYFDAQAGLAVDLPGISLEASGTGTSGRNTASNRDLDQNRIVFAVSKKF